MSNNVLVTNLTENLQEIIERERKDSEIIKKLNKMNAKILHDQKNDGLNSQIIRKLEFFDQWH